MKFKTLPREEETLEEPVTLRIVICGDGAAILEALAPSGDGIPLLKLTAAGSMWRYMRVNMSLGFKQNSKGQIALVE